MRTDIFEDIQDEITRKFAIKADGIARDAIESVRGTSQHGICERKPKENEVFIDFTCDVCRKPTTFSIFDGVPLFCSHCGRVFCVTPKEEA